MSGGATGFLVAALLTIVAAPVASGKDTRDEQLKIVERWPLGGDGGWDYLTLDPAGTRLFLSRSNHVDVVDTASGKVVGTLPHTSGVHGIALSGDLHRGYISNGKSSTVTMFDLDTLTPLSEMPVTGENPDAILYEPVGRHVLTFNGHSKDVTVLDARSLAIVATIPLPDKPEFAVTDGHGRIFVNIESDTGQMAVIDAGTLTVRSIWSLPGCANPTGLALDGIHHRLFSVCANKTMVVTDAASGNQIAQIPIGVGPDAAVFDTRRGLAFSSNGEGTLTAIRQAGADRYRIAYTLGTQAGARTMALDANSGTIYLVSAGFDPAPAPTSEQPHPRPIPKPGTFTVLVARRP